MTLNTITERPDPDRPATHVLLVCSCGATCPKNANRAGKFLDRHPRVCNARLVDVEEKHAFSQQLAEGTWSVENDYQDPNGQTAVRPRGIMPGFKITDFAS